MIIAAEMVRFSAQSAPLHSCIQRVLVSDLLLSRRNNIMSDIVRCSWADDGMQKRLKELFDKLAVKIIYFSFEISVSIFNLFFFKIKIIQFSVFIKKFSSSV